MTGTEVTGNRNLAARAPRGSLECKAAALQLLDQLAAGQ